MFELGGGSLSFAVHGGGDSGGMAGMVSEILAFIEKLVTLSPGQMLAELMPGMSVLENLHPMFVHFPIALLTLFFIVDCAALIASQPNWRKTASHFLYLGTLFSGMTVMAGLIAAGTLPHGDDVHEIMEHHEHLGISVLLIGAALSAWRFMAKEIFEGPANVLFSLSSLILVVLLALTADLGGFMVYGHGVAVLPVMASQHEAAEAHQHADDHGQHHTVSQDFESLPAEGSSASPIEPQAMPNAAPAELDAAESHVHSDGSHHSHAH